MLKTRISVVKCVLALLTCFRGTCCTESAVEPAFDRSIFSKVIFAVKEQNLLDVSDERHFLHQKWLNFDDSIAMTNDLHGSYAVVSWLKEQHIKIISKTPRGEYISAVATIGKWENLLSVLINNSAGSSLVHRATVYSVPEALSEHVSAIFAANQQPLSELPADLGVVYSEQKIDSALRRRLGGGINTDTTSGIIILVLIIAGSVAGCAAVSRFFCHMCSSISGIDDQPAPVMDYEASPDLPHTHAHHHQNVNHQAIIHSEPWERREADAHPVLPPQHNFEYQHDKHNEQHLENRNEPHQYQEQHHQQKPEHHKAYYPEHHNDHHHQHQEEQHQDQHQEEQHQEQHHKHHNKHHHEEVVESWDEGVSGLV